MANRDRITGVSPLHSTIAWIGALLVVPVWAQSPAPDPAGILSHFAIARFLGSGAQSIQAMTSDAAGNIYIAGTTSSPDFATKDAAQPTIGEGVLLRSVDAGSTWQNAPIPLVSLVAVTPHPTDPKTLFGGALDGIYKSSDGGQTWRHVLTLTSPAGGQPVAGEDIFNIVVDPASPQWVYFYASPYNAAGGPIEIFGVSSDGGDTWKQLSVPSPGSYLLTGAPALWVDPNGSGNIGLGSSISRDHGNTWTAMTPLPPEATFGFIFTVPYPGHPGWIYAQGTGLGNLYLSKDWGVSWTKQAAPVAPECDCPTVLFDLRFDSDSLNTLWADDGSYLYMSNDGGATWSVVYQSWYLAPSTPLALLSRSCGGGVLGITTDNSGVIASHDSGATWLPQHLTHAIDVETGPGCAVYAVKTIASDAFVATLSPLGAVQWATFLGGSDLDTSAGIAVDAEGNVYVSGTTYSPDFPVTAPRIGLEGTSNAFAAKFDTNRKLLYSLVIGGEGQDTVTGFAVNAAGEAHLTGRTNSKSFPASIGAFASAATTDDGFAVKFSPEGSLTYSSYLPGFAPGNPYSTPPITVAVAAESGGTALYGGPGGAISRMSADGSSFATVSTQPGPVYAMNTDPQGNVWIGGQAAQGSLETCYYGTEGSAYLTKLQAGTLEQLFQKWPGGCPGWPVSIAFSKEGDAAVGLWVPNQSLPLTDPLMLITDCYIGSPASLLAAGVMRISNDGSSVPVSSYLDTCPQPPLTALGTAGWLYVTNTSYYWAFGGNGVAVLRIPVAPPGAPEITGAFNAFSGALATVSPGMLMTITGSNLASETYDLSLVESKPLPTKLGGVEVRFDGIPAELLQVSPGQIICVVPPASDGAKFGSIQVFTPFHAFTPRVGAAGLSDPLPLTLQVAGNAGLLTTSFPNLPPYGVATGNIQNSDGTPNNAQNPAAAGSTITVFATGLAQAGATGLWWDPVPPTCMQLFICTQQSPTPADARLMPGFIDSIYAIDFQIPTNAIPGEHVLQAQPRPITHAIGVYVK